MSTQDRALELLLDQLRLDQSSHNQSSQTNKSLWFADENCHAIIPELAEYNNTLDVLTNRFDLHQNAQKLGLNSLFNDVDFSQTEKAFDHIYLRISKEKPVTHHAINQAKYHLKPSGVLHIAGHKNEGAKTYIKKTTELFTNTLSTKKAKEAHSATFSHPIPNTNDLDTSEYTQLREIGQYNGKPLYSKPGVFGYNKLDEGSLLLLETLQQENIHPGKDILDLGCGYGLLTLGALDYQANSYTATDNNAAALNAIRLNAEMWDQKIDVIAADAGKGITRQFDLILCNPPFHQGFSVSGELTDKFLQSTQKLLTKNGVAYFVVNSFVGIESRSDKKKLHIKTILNNKKFKVLKFSQ